MNYEEIIQYIEDEKVQIQYDYYYHAFRYNEQEFISMLNEGIKAPILLGKNGDGNNGYFYVSLTKNEICDYSIYDKLSYLPMFIIDDNIKTIKTRNFKKMSHYRGDFMKTFLPFRESEYDNEYQKFLIVPSKYIVGIQFNVYYNFINNYDVKEILSTLKNIIQQLNFISLDLPIIDFSTNTKINKEKILSLNIK